MADLKGGTTGQVLSKATNTDMDFTWSAAPSGSGMVLISTATLSSTTSQSFNNCFTSTYRNYVVVLNVTGAGAEALNIRLRASGTDALTNYNNQYIEAKGTSVVGARGSGVSSYLLTAMRGTGNTYLELQVSKPQEATNTSFVGTSQDPDGGATMFLTSGSNTNNTSYDGFTIYTTTNAMTGTISVYGLAK
jgi:hypothetical protein